MRVLSIANVRKAYGGLRPLRVNDLSIEAGEVAAAYHLKGDAALGIHDGVLRLDQIQPVHAHFLDNPIASLTDAAFADLLGRLGRYVKALDRRLVG